LYDLANVVPTLAKFYHQASEAYEQACTRHISGIIYYVSNPHLLHLNILLGMSTSSQFFLQQFERLFQFAKKIEDLMYTITPEEVSMLVTVSSYS
jgi:hypothetical protein